ncbi:MAG: DUF4974 domain-containing protein [Odoribacter sp.]
MKQIPEKRIITLIAGKMIGVLTESEEKELQQWITADSKNRVFYEQMLRTEYRKERNEYIENLNIDEKWECAQTSNLGNGQRQKRITLFKRIGIAASIAVMVSVGWIWNKEYNKDTVISLTRMEMPSPGSFKAMLIAGNGCQYRLQDTTLRISVDSCFTVVNNGKQLSYANVLETSTESEEQNTIIVPRGGEYEVVLSDQTKIYLNADSKLTFPVHFGKGKREVELEGEAYFIVSKDSIHPFIIRVGNRLNVEVLGTEFNITAYPDENTIATTLNQGSVQISDQQGILKLQPNQQSIFFKETGKMECRRVDASIYSAWTEGRIILENIPLKELMNRLSRWYDLQVVWHDEKSKDYHFSGEILRYENFSEILTMLEKATSVHFDVTGNQVNIRNK